MTGFSKFVNQAVSVMVIGAMLSSGAVKAQGTTTGELPPWLSQNNGTKTTTVGDVVGAVDAPKEETATSTVKIPGW